GVIKRKDVIEAYNHEIIKKEAAEGIVQKLKFSSQSKSFDIGTGYKIMEVEAPSFFWSKSLKDLNLKAKHRIDILLIRRKNPTQTIPIPSADEVIKKGDILVLAGLTENIMKIIKNDTP
ncbi:MAG: TrkA C-terminal domain-containing protein, partial [Candidatus Aminicenantes bacterium]|nr:TrkA C-terminal domain-containing protein [Candidatus Aminicenantes bacterium]